MLSLEEHRVADVPDSVFYIPDFISETEEVRETDLCIQWEACILTIDQSQASLLASIARTPGPRWTQLANRRLQNWGGVPHPKVTS